MPWSSRQRLIKARISLWRGVSLIMVEGLSVCTGAVIIYSEMRLAIPLIGISVESGL